LYLFLNETILQPFMILLLLGFIFDADQLNIGTIPRVKRFCRRVFNAIAILSLVFCLAMAALWARSFWYSDLTGHANSAGSWYVASWTGTLLLHTDNNPEGGSGLLYSQKLTGVESDSFRNISRLGFVDYKEAYGSHRLDVWPPPGPNVPAIIHSRYIRIPDWFLVAVFAVAPIIYFILIILLRRRITTGCCLRCGYDLRATPDRCPECGAVPAKRE
jgi:hypothetical protein